MTKKLSLSTQVIIAVILAVIAGLLLGKRMTVLAPVGNIFLSLIKTLVIPLVFCAICRTCQSLEAWAERFWYCL